MSDGVFIVESVGSTTGQRQKYLVTVMGDGRVSMVSAGEVAWPTAHPVVEMGPETVGEKSLKAPETLAFQRKSEHTPDSRSREAK